ncbi:Pentatricopeptide repeat-containing protein [Quillaja saponaria]|uniref:Pentatricopeptide repeat-containing protein n=1 Tax=Quillaja saponaria TaxID=32244 RepID=A0AAD7P6L8_QUISA|nr:Pentatricopeptide repeat-containing protein [Quillaja saponaria]
MKAGNAMFDSYTYNIWMRTVAAVNDISVVERVIDEMKRDGRVTVDWTTYRNLAFYIDAGLFEKAEKALNELEKRNACKDLSAFQFLITMEWESGCSTYDIRAANALIGAYTKGGLLEKAEDLKEWACRRGAKPNAKTWDFFLDYYLKKEEYKLVMDCLANAISTGRVNGDNWAPSSKIISTLMGHFEREKDVEGAEGLLEILKKSVDSSGEQVFESLIRIYAAAGKTSSAMHCRIKMEIVELSKASKKLLEPICVE